MSLEVFIKAFRLPAQALVAQRIPKKLLLEQSAPTAADKRLINDTGDELWRHAAPKPSTVSVPAFHAPAALAGSAGGDHANTSKAAVVDDVIELALVSAQLRPGGKRRAGQALVAAHPSRCSLPGAVGDLCPQTHAE